MSSRYTNDGRRISSMTHAKRGHRCSFCDAVSYGNGGRVAHARAHVRRGEAIELVKDFGPPAGISRAFLAPDEDRTFYNERGYEEVKP